MRLIGSSTTWLGRFGRVLKGLFQAASWNGSSSLVVAGFFRERMGLAAVHKDSRITSILTLFFPFPSSPIPGPSLLRFPCQASATRRDSVEWDAEARCLSFQHHLFPQRTHPDRPLEQQQLLRLHPPPNPIAVQDSVRVPVQVDQACPRSLFPVQSRVRRLGRSRRRHHGKEQEGQQEILVGGDPLKPRRRRRTDHDGGTK